MTVSTKVIIYGKAGWPYTNAAREDYAKRQVELEYIDVKKDATALQAMLALTGGRREVPVIVDHGKVEVGFGGTWGV